MLLYKCGVHLINIESLTDVTEETVQEGARRAAVEAVNEIVDDHLLQMRCRVAFDALITEIASETASEDFPTLLQEVSDEVTRDALMHEVVDSIVHEDVAALLEDLREEVNEAHRTRERREVTSRVREVVVMRLLLTYLMNSISEKFHTVQVSSYTARTLSWLTLRALVP